MADYSALIDNANTISPNNSRTANYGHLSPTRTSPELMSQADVNIVMTPFSLKDGASLATGGDTVGSSLPMDKDPRLLGGAFSAIFLFWLLINHIQFDGSKWNLFGYYIQCLAFTITFFIVEAVFVWAWFPQQSLMIKNPETRQFALVPTRFKWLNLAFVASSCLLLFFCFSLSIGYLILIFGYWEKFANRGPWLVFSLFITGCFIAVWAFLCWLKHLQTWRSYQSYDYFMNHVLGNKVPMVMDNDDDVFS